MFYFPSPFFPVDPIMLLMPFSVIPVIISCIQEFPDLIFILLPGEDHSNIYDVLTRCIDLTVLDEFEVLTFKKLSFLLNLLLC
jgi:hypothetical protein